MQYKLKQQENQIQTIGNQITEKEQAIQVLSAQFAEKEQVAQTLIMKSAEINGSRLGNILNLFGEYIRGSGQSACLLWNIVGLQDYMSENK